MNFPLSSIQLECLTTIRGMVADKVDGLGNPWLPPSYVMAHVRIESGWDPAVVSTDGRGSIGLMQVLPATVEDLVTSGLLDPGMVDQAVPANSLAAGIAYLSWCREFLMQSWGFHKTILYHPVCEAYNEGPGNVLRGRLDSRYWLKWAYAQQCYAFVDTTTQINPPTTVAIQRPLPVIRPRHPQKLAA